MGEKVAVDTGKTATLHTPIGPNHTGNEAPHPDRNHSTSWLWEKRRIQQKWQQISSRISPKQVCAREFQKGKSWQSFFALGSLDRWIRATSVKNELINLLPIDSVTITCLSVKNTPFCHLKMCLFFHRLHARSRESTVSEIHEIQKKFVKNSIFSVEKPHFPAKVPNFWSKIIPNPEFPAKVPNFWSKIIPNSELISGIPDGLPNRG